MRDLTTPAYKTHFDAFLAGYRHLRPLAERELPLFAAAGAAARLVKLHPVLRTAEDADPLRLKLTKVAADDRRAVLAFDG